ncbi:hypothetical protein [Lysobacter capsici]|uniref:hypothetical protein n=1 Tax=Lysobacter capsici TaxID=435897 RepID=UPI00398CA793
MNLFRNLLFWIVLALVGALAAQLLVQDPGKVVVTYGGMNYFTNVPKALLMLTGGLLALCWCGRCSACRSPRCAGIARSRRARV